MAAVEGITEFLPISSTGHLILASRLMGITATEFVKSFEIAIQLGAIAAVGWMYRKDLTNNGKLWTVIGAAFVPTMILGVIFYSPVKMFLLGNTTVTLAALFGGGLVLIAFEKMVKERNKTMADLNWQTAGMVGLAQAVSMVPGVSRAAATIIGAMAAGLSRKEAVKFSFLLAIPTMAAATGLDLVKSGWAFSASEWGMMGLGFTGAFVTAWITVKIFIKYVQKNTLQYFGVYRLVLAILFWGWVSR